MSYSIREATPDDDAIVLRHCQALSEGDTGDPINMRADAIDVIRDFIAAGRANAEMAAFVAEIDGEPVGSVACQVQNLPYPNVAIPTFRKYGYIWCVYVEPAARRQGVAGALVEAALGHLRAIGCTKAVLHSSDEGEQVYFKAGFRLAKEMRLDLKPPSP